MVLPKGEPKVPVVKKCVSYQTDVYDALEKYAMRNFNGDFSKAQDAINRKIFRFSVTDQGHGKQRVLF